MFDYQGWTFELYGRRGRWASVKYDGKFECPWCSVIGARGAFGRYKTLISLLRHLSLKHYRCLGREEDGESCGWIGVEFKKHRCLPAKVIATEYAKVVRARALDANYEECLIKLMIPRVEAFFDLKVEDIPVVPQLPVVRKRGLRLKTDGKIELEQIYGPDGVTLLP